MSSATDSMCCTIASQISARRASGVLAPPCPGGLRGGEHRLQFVGRDGGALGVHRAVDGRDDLLDGHGCRLRHRGWLESGTRPFRVELIRSVDRTLIANGARRHGRSTRAPRRQGGTHHGCRERPGTGGRRAVRLGGREGRDRRSRRRHRRGRRDPRRRWRGHARSSLDVADDDSVAGRDRAHRRDVRRAARALQQRRHLPRRRRRPDEHQRRHLEDRARRERHRRRPLLPARHPGDARLGWRQHHQRRLVRRPPRRGHARRSRTPRRRARCSR